MKFKKENKEEKLESSHKNKNPLYNPKFVEILKENYMGYAYAWISYVLRGTNHTRFTNGILEQYNGCRKRNTQKNACRTNLHDNLRDNYERINGQSIK